VRPRGQEKPHAKPSSGYWSSTSATAKRRSRKSYAAYATSDMRKPNIIVIVLDTLREDHAQGQDKLVDYGFVKYQNAIAPAPWTLPSHV